MLRLFDGALHEQEAVNPGHGLSSVTQHMNTEEAQLLHGLYYHREIVGEELPYSAAELNWLVQTPIPKGKQWLGEDGKLKSIETMADDYLASIGATSAAAGRRVSVFGSLGLHHVQKGRELFQNRCDSYGRRPSART